MSTKFLCTIQYFAHRSLRNNRTRIHKSLFSAMVLQVLIRLTVYIDQALVRSWLGDRSTSENVTLRGIDNMVRGLTIEKSRNM